MVSLYAAVVAMVLSGTGQTVLLDFYSDHCPSCRAMDQTINDLIAKSYPVERINVNQRPDLCDKFKVQQLPCFVMLVDGREVDRVDHGTSFSRLERMCQLAKPPIRESTPALLAQIPGPGANVAQSAAAPSRQSAPVPTVITPVSHQQRNSNAADAKLLAASVRIRVENGGAYDCGSGTIIDSYNGKALVLTCGHIFRDSQGHGNIEVDVAGPNGTQRVLGTLVSFDADVRDIGLVAIPVPDPVAVARVAPPGYQLQPGQQVVSIGCDFGEMPTARHSQVKSVVPGDAMGPAYLWTTDQPVKGRSGGGLFSEADGFVIGVCNAADPKNDEGFYASLATICGELDRNKLSVVYTRSVNPSLGAGPNMVSAVPPAGTPTALGSGQPPDMPRRMPQGLAIAQPPATQQAQQMQPGPQFQQGSLPPNVASSMPSNFAMQPAAAAMGMPTGMLPHEQSALGDMKRKVKAGATVVCIVNNPNGQSEVFMMENTSAEFRKQLSAEGGPKQVPYQTSFEEPKTRKKLLEWSAPIQENAAWRAEGTK